MGLPLPFFWRALLAFAFAVPQFGTVTATQRLPVEKTLRTLWSRSDGVFVVLQVRCRLLKLAAFFDLLENFSNPNVLIMFRLISESMSQCTKPR